MKAKTKRECEECNHKLFFIIKKQIQNFYLGNWKCFNCGYKSESIQIEKEFLLREVEASTKSQN